MMKSTLLYDMNWYQSSLSIMKTSKDAYMEVEFREVKKLVN